MIHDVIVVGAGPGGSSAAGFLARQGASVLLLDKAAFPRDKVCGDGLTPQALYWLDQLGCIEAVLAQTDACFKECDLYINGAHVLRGRFPENSRYPAFATFLDRRRFDATLLEHAVTCGAVFEQAQVKSVVAGREAVEVQARVGKRPVTYRGRVVIGADGVASVVSRSIGNMLHDGAEAVSIRTYFENVEVEGAQVKVYFDRSFFPGYGWLFADDAGFANVGMGYAFDPKFPILDGLHDAFKRFLATTLAAPLANATQCGRISGGSAAFYKPQRIVADRVLLVGDAANQIDPLNGGGIHKAMEGGYYAAEAVRHALSVGDFSQQTLARYEHLLHENVALDWHTAELFLTIAKNPAMKDFCLFLLTQIGRLGEGDPVFQDFCSGVFSGVVSQSTCLSPRALYDAFPKQAGSWLNLLDHSRGKAIGALRLAVDTYASMASVGRQMTGRPLDHLDWGLEVAANAVKLVERRLTA